MTKKYTDWMSYWIGLRKNLLKCIGTTGTAWLGTNAAAGAGVPITGINWEQAGVMFGVHIAIEVFSYLQKTELAVIVETVETSSTSSDGIGGTMTDQSKTTTTTPVENKP